KKPERGVDFLLENLAARLGERGKNLKEEREEIRALGDGPRLAEHPAAEVVCEAPEAIRSGVTLPGIASAGAQIFQSHVQLCHSREGAVKQFTAGAKLYPG